MIFKQRDTLHCSQKAHAVVTGPGHLIVRRLEVSLQEAGEMLILCITSVPWARQLGVTVDQGVGG